MGAKRFLTVPFVVGATFVLSVGAFAQNTSGPLRVGLSGLGSEALDPNLSVALGRIYLSSMYDEIVGLSPEFKFSGDFGMATKWEVSPDKKQWTFQIRSNAMFHNGVPVTAEDVKFTMDRNLAPESRASQKEDAAAMVANVEVLSPTAIRINLKQPYPGLLTWFGPGAGATGGMVVPKKYLEDVGDKGFAIKPIGSGPYKFVKQVGGASIELESIGRDHFRTGQPKYKTLIWNQVPEETTRVALLRRGDLDIIDVSRASLKDISRQADLGVVYKPGDLTPGLFFGQQYLGGIFSDERMRRALNISINRPELLQTIFGGGGKLNGIPSTNKQIATELGLNSESTVPAYDPAKARQLVKEAGKEGAAFTVYAMPWAGLPEGVEMMEALAGYWSAIGLKPNIMRVDLGAFRKKWRDRDIKDEIFFMGAPSRDWIGHIGFNSLFFNSASTSTVTTDDKELNDLFAKINASGANPEEMKATFAKLTQRVIDQTFSMSLFELDTPYAYRKATVKEWNLTGLPQNFNIEGVYGSK